MTGNDRGGGGALRLSFEAYGVPLLVSTDSQEVYDRLPSILPPGAVVCPEDGAKHTLELNARPDATFDFRVNAQTLLGGLNLALALEILENQLHANVATDAPDRVFVHAGAVGHGESAIVMPGGSFTGKTSLVAEFVKAGAVYYSDEYAVLDGHGLVHPYPKPLSLRGDDYQQVGHTAASLGGSEGGRPLSVGMILVCEYRSGSDWRPTSMSPGEGVLAMLANSVAARSRPGEVLRAITSAVEGAIVVAGDRGEASSVVSAILAEVSA